MKYKTFRNLVVGTALVAVGGAAALILTRPDAPSSEARGDPGIAVATSSPSSTPGTAASTSPASSTSTAASTPPASPSPASVPGLRPVDRDLLSLVARVPVQAKVKDATKGKGYKINLYSDAGRQWERAKVDLDRDEKWDEKWTWKDGTWERKVSSADDDSSYDQLYILGSAGWTRK